MFHPIASYIKSLSQPVMLKKTRPAQTSVCLIRELILKQIRAFNPETLYICAHHDYSHLDIRLRLLFQIERFNRDILTLQKQNLESKALIPGRLKLLYKIEHFKKCLLQETQFKMKEEGSSTLIMKILYQIEHLDRISKLNIMEIDQRFSVTYFHRMKMLFCIEKFSKASLKDCAFSINSESVFRSRMKLMLQLEKFNKQSLFKRNSSSHITVTFFERCKLFYDIEHFDLNMLSETGTSHHDWKDYKQQLLFEINNFSYNTLKKTFSQHKPGFQSRTKLLFHIRVFNPSLLRKLEITYQSSCLSQFSGLLYSLTSFKSASLRHVVSNQSFYCSLKAINASITRKMYQLKHVQTFVKHSQIVNITESQLAQVKQRLLSIKPIAGIYAIRRSLIQQLSSCHLRGHLRPSRTSIFPVLSTYFLFNIILHKKWVLKKTSCAYHSPFLIFGMINRSIREFDRERLRNCIALRHFSVLQQSKLSHEIKQFGNIKFNFKKTKFISFMPSLERFQVLCAISKKVYKPVSLRVLRAEHNRVVSQITIHYQISSFELPNLKKSGISINSIADRIRQCFFAIESGVLLRKTIHKIPAQLQKEIVSFHSRNLTKVPIMNCNSEFWRLQLLAHVQKGVSLRKTSVSISKLSLQRVLLLKEISNFEPCILKSCDVENIGIWPYISVLYCIKNYNMGRLRHVDPENTNATIVIDERKEITEDQENVREFERRYNLRSRSRKPLGEQNGVLSQEEDSDKKNIRNGNKRKGRRRVNV